MTTLTGLGIAARRMKRDAHIAALPGSPYFTVNELSARWKQAASTIRKMSAEALPYTVFCGGAHPRRRYHVDDVRAFEAKRRAA